MGIRTQNHKIRIAKYKPYHLEEKNIKCFREDFMFKIDSGGFTIFKSQIATSSSGWEAPKAVLSQLPKKIYSKWNVDAVEILKTLSIEKIKQSLQNTQRGCFGSKTKIF